MAADQTSKPLSWRDPDGFVVNAGGRILRAVVKDKYAHVRLILESHWFRELIADGSIPVTKPLADPPEGIYRAADWDWLEHEKLPFPGYPHEISALQLYDSAQLTLHIALVAAQNGWLLKDASAWNVLHSNSRPVFIDVLSFEPRPAGNVWIAYGQFVRHFVLPLMVYRRLGITPPEVFLVSRDGLTPERAYELLGKTSFLSISALEFVVFPRWLAPAGGRKIAKDTAQRSIAPSALGGMDLVVQTLRRLQRQLEKLRPNQSAVRSVWKEYERERSHYSDADLEAKKAFVKNHLEESASVLDLGCNAGEFSLLAADQGRSVVATDFDHAALSRLYERIRGKGCGVAPLMLNIARPTPAVGWRNLEVDGFLGRAAGRFDCVLALGLVHHLLISERCSLVMLAGLWVQLAPRQLIIEWVQPEDPRFRQVAGINIELYRHLDAGRFEKSLAPYFRMKAKLVLPCATRVMYLWQRDYN